VKVSLSLWERMFRCDVCGFSPGSGRERGAQLAALVAAVAGSGPDTKNARGRDGSPAVRQAIPEEAGSRQAFARKPASPPGNGWMSRIDFYVPGNS
jgi:putative transposase